MPNQASRSIVANLIGFLALGMMLAGPVPGQSRELDDQDIADAVEDKYLLDRVLDVNRMDITVTEGIVELTGSVDSYMSRDRATRLAELVKGVRSVSNRLEVDPDVKKTDKTLKAEITRALARDPATDSWEIDVSVSDGVVQLKGAVESWAERQLGGKVAASVNGVIDLDNDLNVDYQTERVDTEIAQDIQQRLYWDVLVDSGLVDIEVVDGEVTLSGAVGSAAEKRRAIMDAWVMGVEDVNAEQLKVRWWAKDEELRGDKYVEKTDSEIAGAIRDAALYDPRVVSLQITPEVSDGWVTLRGNVTNLKAKRVAERLAENTVGVRGVTNRIKVRAETEPADDKIETEVREALLDNPFTDSYEIDVYANNGRVTLAGVVNSSFGRNEAERVASGIRGVSMVNNQLSVRDYLGRVYQPHFSYYPSALRHVPLLNTDDDRIVERIEDEYFWSPFVDGEQVTVMVDNGVATLSGTVDTWREYYAAEENAEEGGALAVVNDLNVASD